MRCLAIYTSLVFSVSLSAASYLEDAFPASVREDAKLTTLQLLTKYNYPGAEYAVTTEDNYKLHMQRIPRHGASPVLLMHGLEDSADTWLLMGPHSALGYYLYDAGYDVWMGNARGNRYSRGHTQLNPSVDRAYWNFSFHEIGYYDLAAKIDFVLQQTGKSKLSYVGHSQGTTSIFVLTSSRPEYNEKLHVMLTVAPVAYTTHLRIPRIAELRTMLNVIGDQFELFPHPIKVTDSCLLSAKTVESCMNLLSQFLGKNYAEFNFTMFPVILGHIPAGASSRQFIHYLQMQQSNRFCRYDLGKQNQRVYGRATPPEYPVERITAPVALFYAKNDFLSAVEDVQRLAKRLPNLVENHLYSYKKWNHIDILWGISARRVAQPRMLQVLQHWESGQQTPLPPDSSSSSLEEAETETEQEQQTDEQLP
ncbi:lipase 1 [Drosophila busckii]|uniref:lipase 1 n=1 Tax=Drosophila busckii TaxID=30019 RepID=UPI0014329011|nr:lipase 1 [Drosophila busckii]